MVVFPPKVVVIFPGMAAIPRFPFPLGAMPKIVQTGLSVHGMRSFGSFCQRGLWSLHVYHYQGEFRINGRSYRFQPGWVSLIPPDFVVEWHFPYDAPHYYAHFQAPSARPGIVLMPLLRDLGEQASRIGLELEEMVRYFAHSRRRANVRLWDLLFQLADEHQAETRFPGLHPGLQTALSIIRNTPSDKLLVGKMARDIGVSPNHLTMLFQRQFGCGVRAYIRRDRIGRALDLLARTSLRVKSIAIECGFPDLHYFNKIIRGATGRSPTEFRRARN